MRFKPGNFGVCNHGLISTPDLEMCIVLLRDCMRKLRVLKHGLARKIK